jgi:WXXGXW repeat (2 copies)
MIRFTLPTGAPLAIHSIMKTLVKILIVAAMALLPASTARAQISIGIHIGEPPAPKVYRVPPRPGPDYEWIEGYWYPDRGHYKWHDGYWTHPPYAGAYWVAPYHVGGQYYEGRWEGPRGDVKHDHGWDRGKDRDEHHEPPPHSDEHR